MSRRLCSCFPDRACRRERAPAVAQMSASDVVVRLDQMENQMRMLTGQVEQLQFRNQQLEQQLRGMQQDGRPACRRAGRRSRCRRRPQQPPPVRSKQRRMVIRRSTYPPQQSDPPLSKARRSPTSISRPYSRSARSPRADAAATCFDSECATPNAPGAPRRSARFPRAAIGPAADHDAKRPRSARAAAASRRAARSLDAFRRCRNAVQPRARGSAARARVRDRPAPHNRRKRALRSRLWLYPAQGLRARRADLPRFPARIRATA